MWMTDDVARMSRCELEVDIVASDVTNRLEVDTFVGGNPGLAALWEDERLRRRRLSFDEHLTPPGSPGLSTHALKNLLSVTP